MLPRLSYIRFTTTIGTRADITGEPTVVATTVAITVATLATTVATTAATTVATTVGSRLYRVWRCTVAEAISPDLDRLQTLKSETYRYSDDADSLRKLLIEAGVP